MPFNLLDGYAFHIICRLGTAANVPAMEMGEIGFDTDTRVFRIGNDTSIPEKVMTTNSNIAFDFSLVPDVKFKQISMSAGGKVDGVDLSTLNTAGAGLLSNDGNGAFTGVVLLSGDSSIVITNSAGQGGNPDIRVSPALLSSILSSVQHTSSLSGTGTLLSPLDLSQATTTLRGGVMLATGTEASNGVNADKAVTPNSLATALAAKTPVISSGSSTPTGAKTGDLWWNTAREIMAIYVTAIGWIDISS